MARTTKSLLSNFALAVLIISLGTQVSVAEEKVYQVSPEKSTITWTGQKVTESHTGTVALKEGKAIFENGVLVGGSFEVAMNTIKDLDIDDPKYNKKLTDHLYSDDFFQVEKHPTSAFTITKATALSDVKPGAPNYSITGNLTIKAATFPLTFPAVVTLQDSDALASAQVSVDRTKYNIRYGSGKFFKGLGDKLIYDEFKVELKLVSHLKE